MLTEKKSFCFVSTGTIIIMTNLKVPLYNIDQISSRSYIKGEHNRVFSRDVTAAMLVSLNKETAAMLVTPTNPPGFELFSYANAFFCFALKTCSLIT